MSASLFPELYALLQSPPGVAGPGVPGLAAPRVAGGGQGHQDIPGEQGGLGGQAGGAPPGASASLVPVPPSPQVGPGVYGVWPWPDPCDPEVYPEKAEGKVKA